MMPLKTIKKTQSGALLKIQLNRPEIRNAFNQDLIQELTEAFRSADSDPTVRAVILSGHGKIFCAGGDLNWMQKSLHLSKEENLVDTKNLCSMFETMNHFSKPLIGLIQGAAIGGGVGLVSVCDYIVSTQTTTFSLAEVRLGIIPACIGPYVIAKIGESFARAYFTSALRFGTTEALRMGLIHEIVADENQLQSRGDDIANQLLECGPYAMKEAKALISDLKKLSHEEAVDHVAEVLARLRVSPEGQEGLKAFLEKRQPSWVKSH